MEIRWQRWDVKFLYKLENCFNLKKKNNKISNEQCEEMKNIGK